MGKSDVEAGEAAWLKAFNSGDAAGVAKQYSQDARLMPPNSDIIAGRDAIEAFTKEFVATGASLSFNLLTVHEGGDIVAAVGTYEMSIPVPGGEPQLDSGKYIEVWQRQSDGAWLIVDDVFNSSLPAPG
jgi:uncharacterized protein (TIGR02246 family)